MEDFLIVEVRTAIDPSDQNIVKYAKEVDFDALLLDGAFYVLA